MNLRYNQYNIELKSRNFEKLQHFSAFSRNLRKSERVSLETAKIAMNYFFDAILFLHF